MILKKILSFYSAVTHWNKRETFNLAFRISLGTVPKKFQRHIAPIFY